VWIPDSNPPIWLTISLASTTLASLLVPALTGPPFPFPFPVPIPDRVLALFLGLSLSLSLSRSNVPEPTPVLRDKPLLEVAGNDGTASPKARMVRSGEAFGTLVEWTAVFSGAGGYRFGNNVDGVDEEAAKGKRIIPV
jgi:hypothetical protein